MKQFFEMKKVGELQGYTQSDGTEIKSELQGFVAEMKKLTPEDKSELRDLLIADGFDVEPLEG
jgi:hypothetical protein